MSGVSGVCVCAEVSEVHDTAPFLPIVSDKALTAGSSPMSFLTCNTSSGSEKGSVSDPFPSMPADGWGTRLAINALING